MPLKINCANARARAREPEQGSRHADARVPAVPSLTTTSSRLSHNNRRPTTAFHAIERAAQLLLTAPCWDEHLPGRLQSATKQHHHQSQAAHPRVRAGPEQHEARAETLERAMASRGNEVEEEAYAQAVRTASVALEAGRAMQAIRRAKVVAPKRRPAALLPIEVRGI